MAPFEIDGTNGPQPVRRINPVSAQQARTATATGGAKSVRPTQDGPVVETASLDGLANLGQPTAQPERVAQIRKAIESGSYPLIPTKVADAMIAAGMFLRKGA